VDEIVGRDDSQNLSCILILHKNVMDAVTADF
jgi:hypothetical protein